MLFQSVHGVHAPLLTAGQPLAVLVAPGSLATRLGSAPRPARCPSPRLSPVALAKMAEKEDEKPIKTLTAEDIRLLKTVSRAGRPAALGGAASPLRQPWRPLMRADETSKLINQ